MHGRGDPHDVGHLVAADEAAQVVGRLDVEVERQLRHPAHRSQHADAEVGGDVDGVGAEPVIERGGGGVGGAQHRGGLEPQIGRQRSRGPQPREHVEHADVSHQQAADAVRARAAGLGQARLDRLRPAGHAGRRLGHQRLAAGVPAAAGTQEQAHLDATVVAERRHLIQLLVGQHHHAGALRDPLHPDALPVGLVKHRAQHPGALDAGDLDAVAAAVLEPPARLRPVPRRRAQAHLRQHRREPLAVHRASLVWFT